MANFLLFVGNKPPRPDPAALHAAMQSQVRELEEALAHVPVVLAPGIGHNEPPADVLTADDIRELREAVDLLKAQPVEPADKGASALAAVAAMETSRQKLTQWAVGLGDAFVTEATKEAGKQFGKWGPATFFIWVMNQILGLSKAVDAWVKMLQAGSGG